MNTAMQYTEVSKGRLAWHFRLPEDQWYISSAQDIADGYDALALLKRDGTCKMPPWWRPDRREVCATCRTRPPHGPEYSDVDVCRGGPRITADLNTGAEVTA